MTYKTYISNKTYKTYFFYSLFFVSLFTFHFSLSTRSARAAVLSRPPNNLGLIGAWNFDEGVGTKAGDSSGNGNTGTLTNMEASDWVSGKRGKALSFDGSNEVVTTPPTDLISNYTISMWYKNANIPTTALIDQPFSWNSVTDGKGIVFSWDHTNSTFTQAWAVHDGAYTALKYTTSLLANTWYHLVITYDGTTARAYLNGVQEAFSVESAPGDTGTERISIAAGTGGTAVFDDGTVDDVRIYSRALTAAQVKSLYQSGQATRKVVSNRGLVGAWNFNEGVGTTVGDMSGNAYTGNFPGGSANPSWVDGKHGKASSFDGTSDYVNLLSTPAFSNDLTVALWIKPTDTTTDDYISDFGDENEFALIKGYQDGYYNVFGGVYPCQGNPVTSQIPMSGAGIWDFVVWTKSATTLKGYVNGVERTSCTMDSGDMIPSASLRIGKPYNTGSNYFGGLIDDYRLYSRALSGAEVAVLYKQGESKVNTSQNNSLTNGLVGLWSFNGPDYNSASTTAEVLDRSGQGNNGNNNGATRTIGKVGQALSFDGVDDNVAVGAASLNVLSSGPDTVNVWVKNISSATRYGVVSEYGNVAPRWLLAASNSTVRVYYAGAATSDEANATGLSLNNGAWHMVTAVRNGTTVAIYIDGTQTGTPVTDNSQNVSNNSNQLYFGSIWGNAEWISGQIDEVRIYNRALSADEVKQLYNLGR